MVMVAAIEACAEAARLAEAAGVDFALVRQAMLGGSAGSRVLDAFGGRMAARDFTPGVEARLHHKDYALLMDEASRIGAPLPVSAAVWQQLNALMALALSSKIVSCRERGTPGRAGRAHPDRPPSPPWRPASVSQAGEDWYL
jgi:3-hydroxyisobutyrate dehydrogenase-like beta-hydroxyacid dehydrogenase